MYPRSLLSRCLAFSFPYFLLIPASLLPYLLLASTFAYLLPISLHSSPITTPPTLLLSPFPFLFLFLFLILFFWPKLEVVCVCWDALDGSTLYQLLSQQQLPFEEDLAARFMMAFWYLSVGCRMAFMMLSHLAPTDKLYRLVLSPPLSLAPQPTVDRTLQSLRLRSEVILVMGAAELFAASLRISLWTHGYFLNDTLQQEMTIKNVLFLGSVYGAYSMWTTSAARDWCVSVCPFVSFSVYF